MGDENPIHTLRDYFKPSHEGYQNTIELPKGNNMVPLLSDTIHLVQNGCSFHGLWSEDPNQHLNDFLKLVDLLVLDVANRKYDDCHEEGPENKENATIEGLEVEYLTHSRLGAN
uniref:MAK10-like protein n=1 Tax=Tanacetum cinerariifolium TaxID=118510 RepID=A0A699IZI4_TANCI|nr:MAK10-like protein [Tanacetum cinerariifolium]